MSIKIENVVLPSAEQWEAIIRGARNPKNSWDRMDSYATHLEDPLTMETADYEYFIGENDQQLLEKLAAGGPVHAKYRRMITVYMDITAPLYFWKEFDKYQIGVVTNSCSTMHKIHAKEFTLEDFSCEHLIYGFLDISDMDAFEELADDEDRYFTAVDNETGYLAIFNQIDEDHRLINYYSPKNVLESFIIPVLNANREAFLETKDKKYWWQMIQLLPSSYNQKRTVMLNYEVLANIYKWRKDHKLDCWRTFCDWIETIPYQELITGVKKDV